MNLFDDTKVPLLSKALDVYSLRHKVISSNIANIGTVGYKSKSVQFEGQLAGAMKNSSVVLRSTDARHLGGSAGPDLNTPPSVVAESDENGLQNDPNASGVNDVDIDREMTELAKNQIQFKMATKLLGETFSGLEKSIRGSV